MKLIWHIIRKDIGSERWTLLFWMALYVAQTGLGLVVFHHDYGEHEFVDAVWLGNLILVAMQFVTAYVLVVRLVQADAIVGTRMFWLTRPIAPGRLLRAKGWGAVLLFGLLPVLLRLPWWIYCGFTVHDVAWVAVETVGWQLLLITPAFLIASLTDDFGRALMWGLLLIVFLSSGVFLLYTQRILNLIPVSGVSSLLFTKLWLSAFLLSAGSAAVAAHQFQTRHFVRSVAFAVSMVVVALIAGRLWPWDCTILFTQINDPEPAPVATADIYPGLQVTVGTAQTNGTWRNSGEKESRIWIQQTMEIRGVPEGLGLGAVRLHQSWSWPDDPAPAERNTLYFGDWSYRELRQILELPAWQGDPETARWQEKLNADRRARGEPVFAGPSMLLWKPQAASPDGRMTLFGRTTVRESVVARIRARAPAGTAQVELELGRPGKLFELPLKRGAVWSGASRAYRVGLLEGREENRAAVLLTTARPAVWEKGLWSAGAMDRDFHQRSSGDTGFIAVNRSDNTLGSTSQSGDTSKSGQVVIGGVALRWDKLNVYSARVIRNGKWVASDPDWTEHVTLAVIKPEQLIWLTREFKEEKYELRPDESEPAKAGDGKKNPADKI